MDKLADVLRERRLLNHKCGIIVPTNRDLFSVTNKLKERGIEVHQAIAVRRGGTPPDFDSLTPIIASYHNAKGLTFDCVLLPKLVENNFQRVTGERRRRLLLVGITRATQWVYLSTVRGWELRRPWTFSVRPPPTATCSSRKTPTPFRLSATPTASLPGDDDNDASFL